MTHFVYPYIIPKSPIFGWELLYSIRSIYRYFKGPFDITVIGEIPSWINTTEIRCITFNNNDYQLRVQSKTNQKILLAADLYPDMVLMHDDFYLMHSCIKEDLQQPRYLEKKLNYNIHNENGLTRFGKQIRHTYFELLKHQKDASRNFCTHAPFYYESDKLKELDSVFNLAQVGVDGEYTIITENAYWNYFETDAIPLGYFRQGLWGSNQEEFKVNPEAIIFNHDEKAFLSNTWILEMLIKRFNNKCKGEL